MDTGRDGLVTREWRECSGEGIRGSGAFGLRSGAFGRVPLGREWMGSGIQMGKHRGTVHKGSGCIHSSVGLFGWARESFPGPEGLYCSNPIGFTARDGWNAGQGGQGMPRTSSGCQGKVVEGW